MEESRTDDEGTGRMVLEIAERVCKVLNRANGADPGAVLAMFRHRVPVNETLRDDPTIQVGADSSMGILGLINGLVGIQRDGRGCVVMDCTLDDSERDGVGRLASIQGFRHLARNFDGDSDASPPGAVFPGAVYVVTSGAAGADVGDYYDILAYADLQTAAAAAERCMVDLGSRKFFKSIDCPELRHVVSAWASPQHTVWLERLPVAVGAPAA